MRLADRIINDGVQELRRWASELERDAGEAIQSDVRLARVVDATNVYAYCREQEVSDLYDLPCGAPPHDLMFVEWLQKSGTRCGALGFIRHPPFQIGLGTPSEVIGANGLRKLVPPETSLNPREEWYSRERIPMWLSDNLRDQAAWDQIRWVWGIGIFVEKNRRPMGPMATIRAALDEWGRLVDVTWAVHVKVPEGTDVDPLTLHPFQVFITTINFMQCANIETAYVDPPAALSRKHRKKGNLKPGQDLLRYHVLKVRSRSGVKVRGSSGPSQNLTAFHSVRGGFHHYGDCCPGLHEPRGLYFGKYEGKFFVPAHVAGNPQRGVVDKDFSIEE